MQDFIEVVMVPKLAIPLAEDVEWDGKERERSKDPRHSTANIYNTPRHKPIDEKVRDTATCKPKMPQRISWVVLTHSRKSS